MEAEDLEMTLRSLNFHDRCYGWLTKIQPLPQSTKLEQEEAAHPLILFLSYSVFYPFQVQACDQMLQQVKVTGTSSDFEETHKLLSHRIVGKKHFWVSF